MTEIFVIALKVKKKNKSHKSFDIKIVQLSE